LYRKATRDTELQECALVKSLRKVLFLHAAVSGVIGIACVAFPQTLLKVLQNDTPAALGFYVSTGVTHAVSETILVRLLGVQTFVQAMFMVLVAQKIEAVWWWSWAFAIADIAVALLVTLHALFGLAQGETAFPWLITVILCLGFSVALLWGLFKAQQDQPIIEA
jgi:hypothetical protein